MNKQIGKASLGWLCILAAILWIGYKFEYFKLLLGAWTNTPTGDFDKAAETRLLLFILSPSIILVLVGIVLIVRSAIKARHPNPPSTGLPIV